MTESISDIGELELINRLKSYVAPGQLDDDTATIKIINERVIINTDVLVENIHFSESTMHPIDVGWKAVVANISDLVSSGTSELLGITIGLVLPQNTKWQWVDDVYKGIEEALFSYGGEIYGGDCVRGNEKILSITALGAIGELKLHRANALTGDCLVTSGIHGLSRIGLSLLQEDSHKISNEISSSLKSRAIRAHQRPEAPLEALRALIKSKPKTIPSDRAAGTDSSDGLLEAIYGICRSSQCQAVLYRDQIPMEKELSKNPLFENWCLNGGEDYELVLSLPKKWADEWIKNYPSARNIGYVKKGEPKITWENGELISVEKKFNHF